MRFNIFTQSLQVVFLGFWLACLSGAAWGQTSSNSSACGGSGSLPCGPSAGAAQQQQSINTLCASPIVGNQTVTLPGGGGGTVIRGYAIPGESPLPPYLPVPPQFAPPVTDGNFGNLLTFIDYKDRYSLADAEALMENKSKVKVLTTCYVPESLRTSKAFLRILLPPKKPQEKEAFKRQYELIGMGTYQCRNTKSTSEQVLGVAIKEGLEMGADAMLFQEGAALVQQARGWSIGLFNSLSATNSNITGYGNVAVGGLGYGRGETGYVSKPWLRVQFFREVLAAAQPTTQRPITKPLPPTPPKKEINNYEEALEKEGPEVTPEEAYTGKEFLRPEPPRR